MKTRNETATAINTIVPILSTEKDERYLEYMSSYILDEIEGRTETVKKKASRLIESLQELVEQLDDPDRGYYGGLGSQEITNCGMEIDRLLDELSTRREMVSKLAELVR